MFKLDRLAFLTPQVTAKCADRLPQTSFNVGYVMGAPVVSHLLLLTFEEINISKNPLEHC